MTAGRRARVERTTKEAGKAMQGLDPVGTTPAQFDKLIRAEIDKWTKIIAAGNIKPE